MKKIAIISASTPANGNTGMISAEFGALSLLKEFPKARLSWITFPSKPGSVDNAFTKYVKKQVDFKTLPEAVIDLEEYDAIFYWGDFLNSWTFVRVSAPRQVKAAGLDMNPDTMADMLFKCLLLEGMPDKVMNRVILFGGTILSNQLIDYKDQRYEAAFTRLIKKAHRVMMRDAISAARVKALRGSDDSCQGVDPAMLFEDRHTDKSSSSEKRIGVYVGSRTLVPPGFSSALDQMEKQFGYQVVWIPWMQKRKRIPKSVISRMRGFLKMGLIGTTRRKKEVIHSRQMQSAKRVASLCEKYFFVETHDIFDLLKLVSGCKAVITDTYHLNLNSWRMGVPAICIGDAEPATTYSGRGTLLNLKKFVFNLEFHAEEYYKTGRFFKQSSSCQELHDLIQSANCTKVFAALDSRVKLAEKALFEAVHGLMVESGE